MSIKEEFNFPNQDKGTFRSEDLAIKLFKQLFEEKIDFPLTKSNDIYSKWFCSIQWLFLFVTGKISKKTINQLILHYISLVTDFDLQQNNSLFFTEKRIKDNFSNINFDYKKKIPFFKSKIDLGNNMSFESDQSLISDLENLINTSESYKDLYPDQEEIDVVKGNSNKFFKFLATLSLISTLNEKTIGKIFSTVIFIPQFIASQKSEYTSPRFINEILARLVEPKDGDTVYDPAAGIGESLVACASFNPMIRISGAEIDPMIYRLAKMNFILNKIPVLDFINKNSLAENNVNKLFDAAVCIPPFGLDLQNTNASSKKKQSLELLFLEHVLKKIKDGGRIGILMPSGFLANSNLEQYRKEFIQEVTLRLILSIPHGFFLPNMGLETTLLIFEKTLSRPSDKCLIIDGKILSVLGAQSKTKTERPLEAEAFLDEIENIYKSSKQSNNIPNRWIDQAELIHSISNWSPSRFINESFKLENQFILQGSELVSLGALVKPLSSNATPDLNSEIPFIGTRHLKSDPSFPFLSADLISEKLKYWGQTHNTQTLDSEALLVSLKWNYLKPTLFQPKGGPISIKKGDILALTINEEMVIPQYLVFQLDSDYIKEQLKGISKGTAVKFITQSDILRIKIPLPSLKEQKEFLSKRQKIKKDKSVLSEFISKIQLYENYSDQKKELIRFTSTYFPESPDISFIEEWDFSNVPFQTLVEEGEEWVLHDKILNAFYLVIQKDKVNLRGILKISNCFYVEPEWYKEINAYAIFLFKIGDFISRSTANSQLATFAHTSKNFFASLQSDIKAIVNSPNIELLNYLSKSLIDDPDLISMMVTSGNSKEEDFYALQRLHNISIKVSSFASFYQKASSLYRGIIERVPEEFDLLEIIKSADTQSCCSINCSMTKVMVYAKKQPLSLAIADIISNAYVYSSDKKCTIDIYAREQSVEVVIDNYISLEGKMEQDKYDLLGKEWLTKSNGDGASSGIYSAFKAINDSFGEISVLPYDIYINGNKFVVEIRLRIKR